MPMLEVKTPIGGKSVLQQYNDDFMTEEELNDVLEQLNPAILPFLGSTRIDTVDVKLYKIAHVKEAIEKAALFVASKGTTQ